MTYKSPGCDGSGDQTSRLAKLIMHTHTKKNPCTCTAYTCTCTAYTCTCTAYTCTCTAYTCTCTAYTCIKCTHSRQTPYMAGSSEVLVAAASFTSVTVATVPFLISAKSWSRSDAAFRGSLSLDQVESNHTNCIIIIIYSCVCRSLG